MSPEKSEKKFETPEQALAYLEEQGAVDDAEIDPAEAALAFALQWHPGISLDRYRQHLVKLSDAVAKAWKQALEGGAEDDGATAARVMRDVMYDAFEYSGDADDFDNLDNADLMRVIDERKGLPVALGILYIAAGRAQGWDVDGLSFPGHFLIRLSRAGQRLIIDPFRDGMELGAAELRIILKSIIGEHAELSYEYYERVSPRDIVIRLENNMKTRLIEAEDYQAAAKLIDAMILFDPGETRLLFDGGVIHAKIGDRDVATDMLGRFIGETTDTASRQEAEILLRQLRSAPEQN